MIKLQEIAELLTETEVFDGLDPADLEFIAGCGTNVAFRAGESIAREGAPAEHFYVIRAGKVALEVAVPQAEALEIETLGPGEVLGWSWLFPPYRWAFDVRAVEQTRAVSLDGTCLRGKCADDTRLGFELMQRFARVMTARLQATRLQLLDVYGRDRAS